MAAPVEVEDLSARVTLSPLTPVSIEQHSTISSTCVWETDNAEIFCWHPPQIVAKYRGFV